jgi:hypothetical protein
VEDNFFGPSIIFVVVVVVFAYGDYKMSRGIGSAWEDFIGLNVIFTK